jgi:hypothetical protein
MGMPVPAGKASRTNRNSRSRSGAYENGQKKMCEETLEPLHAGLFSFQPLHGDAHAPQVGIAAPFGKTEVLQ